MEYIIIAIVLMVLSIILKNIYGISIKKIKELSQPCSLDEITNRLPEDEEVCRQMLEQIHNNKVTIKRSLDEKSRNKSIYGNERHYFNRKFKRWIC